MEQTYAVTCVDSEGSHQTVEVDALSEPEAARMASGPGRTVVGVRPILKHSAPSRQETIDYAKLEKLVARGVAHGIWHFFRLVLLFIVLAAIGGFGVYLFATLTVMHK